MKKKRVRMKRKSRNFPLFFAGGKSTKKSPQQMRSAQGSVDRRLLFLTLLLLFFGLLMIYSASAVVAYHTKGSTFHYLLRQLIWISLGFFAMYVAARFPLDLLQRSSAYIIILAIAGLLAVLILGEDINGARRWIYISDFSFQPSEVAKLAFVIYLAAWLSRTRGSFKKLKEVVRDNIYNDLLPFMFLIGVICGLVLMQPDLDTAVIIAFTALAVYFVAGKDAIHTLGSIFIVGFTGLLGVGAAILAPYRLQRVNTFLQFLVNGNFTTIQKRNEAFQVWNGLLAVANGGLLGVGYGASTQKLYYLQETAWTDSIFAVIAEEFGLLGCVAVIVGFLYFLSIGYDIATHARSKFSALLAFGITTWIALQAFLNIGANLAVVPFGGMPLPLLSYGGSNTIAVMAGIGLLLNVSRQYKSKRTTRR